MKKKLNITVIGPGAVGTELAARLAATNAANITVVGKEGSERLNALQERGATVVAHPSDLRGDVAIPAGEIHTTHDTRQITERQDYVIVAIKAYDLTKDFVDRTLTPLITQNPHIKIVLAQNGIPPWFNHRVEGLGAFHLKSVDPTGEILQGIGPQRILGMVLNRVTNYMDEPGVVVNCSPPPLSEKDGSVIPRLIIGKPSGSPSKSAEELAQLLTNSGMNTDNVDPRNATIPRMLHHATLYKLMLNIIGAVCAITGKSLGETLHDPKARAFAGYAISEALEIAPYYKVDVLPHREHFLEVAGALTHYKPSILKDLEHGKPVEISAIVKAASDIRKHFGKKSPVLNELAKYVKELAESTASLSPEPRRTTLERHWQSTTPERIQRVLTRVESEEAVIPMEATAPTPLQRQTSSEDNFQAMLQMGIARLYLAQYPHAARQLGLDGKMQSGQPKSKKPSPQHSAGFSSSEDEGRRTAAPARRPPISSKPSREDSSSDSSISLSDSETEEISRPNLENFTFGALFDRQKSTVRLYWQPIMPGDITKTIIEGKKVSRYLTQELSKMAPSTDVAIRARSNHITIEVEGDKIVRPGQDPKVVKPESIALILSLSERFLPQANDLPISDSPAKRR